MPAIEIRELTQRNSADGSFYQAPYLYVDGSSRLRFIHGKDGDVAFEWTRKPEDFDLGEAVRMEIPRLVGLAISPNEVAVHESGLRVDARFENGGNLTLTSPGDEMNLLIADTNVTPGLIGWVVNHHLNPEGMDDNEAIATIINNKLRDGPRF